METNLTNSIFVFVFTEKKFVSPFFPFESEELSFCLALRTLLSLWPFGFFSSSLVCFPRSTAVFLSHDVEIFPVSFLHCSSL